MDTSWKSVGGLLGRLQPLLGEWVSLPQDQISQMPARCCRLLRPFGEGWIEMQAQWDIGAPMQYREFAFFGAATDGLLGFYSFTNDGHRSEGKVSDGSDVHPGAVAFEARMPAGLARMVYWPLESAIGFNFAVESRTPDGWSRFLRHEYRPA